MVGQRDCDRTFLERRPRARIRDQHESADLTAALGTNQRAKATFEGFSPSNRREYVEWITEAKTAATRETRLKTAVQWMAEGKPRNWKYMKPRP